MKKDTILTFLFLPLLLLACVSEKSTHGTSDAYLPGADGAELYYKVMGSGVDTVVVVHGGPGAGMQSVLPSVESLAEDFVLILYDQRGGGRSTLPEDTTKLQPNYFTEDLEAVRTHFNLEKMNLLTHSFGSVLAAEYAIKYPDHINRMVFHGATGPVRSDMGEYYRQRAANAPPSPDTTLSKRASELLQSLLNGTAENAAETCREYEQIGYRLAEMRGDTVNYRGTTCDAPPEAVHYYYKYTAQLAPQYYGMWDYSSKLSHVSAPLLVVYGEEDSLAISTQRDWAEAVPNGRLLLVPNAEKGAFSDNPDFTYRAVKTFFNGNWPAEAEEILQQ